MENLSILHDKYIIINRIEGGGTSDVYLVQNKETKNKYAAKVLKCKEDEDLINNEISPLICFKREVSALKILSDPNIINYIESGEGPLILNGEPKGNKKYIILELAEKGDLWEYVILPKEHLGEQLAKIIFYKICKAIQVLHKIGLCHRDLKLENILIDEHFHIKLSDFGFSALYKQNDKLIFLLENLGTQNFYLPPEIILRKPYYGDKADIFCLGVLLKFLVTKNYGFGKAKLSDPLYKLTVLKKTHKKFWEYFSKTKLEIDTSEEFKQLYLKMVSFQPKDRPTIDEILEKDPWLQEIRDLNKDQLKQKEDELKKKLNEIEKEIIERKKEIKEEVEGNTPSIININSNNRGENDFDFQKYFNDISNLQYEKPGLNMKYYIEMKGEIDPVIFMNSLANELENKECEIIPSERYLEFDAVFKNIEKKENKEDISDDFKKELEKLGIKEDEEYDIIKSEIISKVQVKLFENDDEGYLLRFEKHLGCMDDFFQNFQKIKSIAKQILN